MNDPRFSLEPYRGSKSRYACPRCQKSKQFVRYIDRQSGQSIADWVGRCNREAQCGYHYTPKQYLSEYSNSNLVYSQQPRHEPTQLPPTVAIIDTLPNDVLQKSLTSCTTNPFIVGLAELFSWDVALDITKNFHIGTTRSGGTIFWQVDNKNRVRTGKIIHYDAATLKRVKTAPDGSEMHPQWAHRLLGHKGYNLRQTLFGLHRLARDDTQLVAIVEAEKTAAICSVYLPQYLWLATGGSHATQLTDPETVACLLGRSVTLFPDTGATSKWEGKARALAQLGVNIQVSEALESLNRPPNWDLADEFLAFRKTVSLKTGTVSWGLTAPDGYPAFWDYPV